MRPLAAVCLVLALALASAVDGRELGTPLFGIKGGVGGANMYGDATGGFETRIGGVFGAYVEYPLAPLVSVQGELLYALKGWKTDAFCSGCEITQTLGYIQIPVLLRINSPAGPPGPYLIMGPVVNMKVNDSFDVNTEAEQEGVSAKEYKSFDVGLMLGGGVEFPAGARTVFMEIRADGSGTPAYEDVGAEEVDAQNWAVSLAVGMTF
jgi:energy-converting hydrogenase Eha subunit B